MCLLIHKIKKSYLGRKCLTMKIDYVNQIGCGEQFTQLAASINNKNWTGMRAMTRYSGKFKRTRHE